MTSTKYLLSLIFSQRYLIYQTISITSKNLPISWILLAFQPNGFLVMVKAHKYKILPLKTPKGLRNLPKCNQDHKRVIEKTRVVILLSDRGCRQCLKATKV